MDTAPVLSVIIPIGPEEVQVPEGLLHDLQFLPGNSELIFVVSDPQFDVANRAAYHAELKLDSVSWLSARQGRAVQMNAGANVARGEFLWFLHLDSRFEAPLIERLLANLQDSPDSLHYCLLAFMKDGPQGMRLNGIGANLRSFVFGTPFGDQGLALSRQSFEKVGGYPELVHYGEDHLFVWYARQQGLRLKCCREYLVTSARKYQKRGWFYLTCRYQYLWIKQAIPELFTLIRKRYF